MPREALNKCLCKRVAALGDARRRAYPFDISRFLCSACLAPYLARRLIKEISMIKQFVALLLLLFVTSMAYAQESNVLDKVESSARSWLELVDHGNYQESWENLSPLLKAKTSAAEWIKLITALRASRGAMSARYIATAGAAKTFSGFPEGEYIQLQFYTTFTKKGLALETITLIKAPPETWQVLEYSIK